MDIKERINIIVLFIESSIFVSDTMLNVWTYCPRQGS